MADRLLVVGGGTMGSGIAFVAARGGYDVAIVEPIEAARDRSRALLEREAERFGDREALERIRWAESIPERSDAMLAIEAVPERFDLKRDVLAALSAVLQADAVIATNTSSLSVGDLADTATHPERVLGLHFFNPATRWSWSRSSMRRRRPAPRSTVRSNSPSGSARRRSSRRIRPDSSSTAWRVPTICSRCARSRRASPRSRSSMHWRAAWAFAWGRSSSWTSSDST